MMDYTIIKFGVEQLPWHIDTAIIGSVFMLIGYKLRISANSALTARFFDKNWSIINKTLFVIFLIIIGILSIQLNPSDIIFSENRYGDFFLMFVSGTCCSLVILIICKKICERVHFKLLAYLGNTTIIIMAFNYFFNNLSRDIYNSLALNKIIEFNWIIQSVMVLLLSCMVRYIKDKIANVLLPLKHEYNI